MTNKNFEKLYIAAITAINKQKKANVDECDIVAGDMPASDVVSTTGNTASDILGKCQHDNNMNGFFDKDCFHIPKPIFKEPMRRTKKNKKQKINIITDKEHNRL